MSFLFVDRILTLNPGAETIGLKQVTANDIYLAPNTKGKHNLFPCVIGEALGQLCSWNVLKTSDFKYRPVGGVIQEIKLLGKAYIGDTVHLESNINSLDTENNLVSFSGHASVNGKTILTIDNSLAPLLPLEDFNHLEKVKENFYSITTSNVGCHTSQDNLYSPRYDAILSHTRDHEISAQKHISPAAPYFADHFPKKPVFPLSLLMEYNLHLAHSLISEKSFHPVAIRKVKIGNFILPKDTLVTKIKFVERKEDGCTLQFLNTVENKRVCTAEVEFRLGEP